MVAVGGGSAFVGGVEMSKPDWKDAPDWANWLACDHSGSWGWFAKRPRTFNDYCWDIHDSKDAEDRWMSIDIDWVLNEEWLETLEPRP